MSRNALNRFMVPRIPQYSGTLRFTKKLRFLTSANLSAQITRANLLNLFVYATTTSNSFRWLSSVRVVAVEAWGQDPAFAAAANEVSVEWESEDGPNVTVSSVTTSTTPAYVKTRPPARSLAGFWADQGYDEATNLFMIVAPIGSTIDVTVELCAVQDAAGSAGPTSAAHLSVGSAYVLPLDGATGVAKPVDQLVFVP